jgi:hypothetical protein
MHAYPPLVMLVGQRKAKPGRTIKQTGEVKADFVQRWPLKVLFAYGLGAGLFGILFQLGGGIFETDMVVLPITFSLGIITFSKRLDERERQIWFIALDMAFLALFSTLVALIGVL